MAGQDRVRSYRRWLMLLLGAAISIFFLWTSLDDLHLGEVWDGIRRANYGWVVPGLIVYFTSVWVRSWRWAFLLRGIKRLSGNELFSVLMIGYMGNNIFPFRLGEVLRAYVLWRREKINFGATFTTAIVERLFDGLTMVLFVVVGLQFIPLAALVEGIVAFGSIVFFGALIVFLVMASSPRLLQRLAESLIARWIPLRFQEALRAIANGVIEGLEALRQPKDVLIVFGLTLATWLLEVGNYLLISRAFGLSLSVPAILVMSGAVNLLTALPSLPGYVGTFEKGIDILKVMGVPENKAGSYVLVLHTIIWLPVVLVGLFFFTREGLTWADIKTAAQRQEG